jgi:hypothetical protein
MSDTTMHEELEQLLALHALGALDGDDLARLEAHLATGCATCAAELAELERVGGYLAWCAPATAPPDALRERLLDSLEARPQPTHGPIPFPNRVQPPAPRSRTATIVAAAALLAAAAVAVVFLTTALLAAQSRLDDAVRQLADARTRVGDKDAELAKQASLLDTVASPEARFVQLSAGAPAEPGVAVVWNPEKGRGVLTARSLPKTADDKAYELWLIADGAPVPAAVFNTDVAGNAMVEIRDLPTTATPKVFAITVEPASGSPAPTTKPILAGNYGA